jgi:ATP-dependent Clp protease ATP-binding subunit ClpC
VSSSIAEAIRTRGLIVTLPFTPRADRVIRLAEREAGQFRHEFIGTEHLILGLIREDTGIAARILTALGVNASEIRGMVERIIQYGPAGDRMVFGHLPCTPRAKSVLTLAAEEARDLGFGAVGPEHLLLGLVREEEGVAAQVLLSLGADFRALRAEVARRRPAPASWRTGTVTALARGFSADRAFGLLPILADALEEAGCADEDVLSHLRQGAAHGCREPGCWVLDRLLSDEQDVPVDRPDTESRFESRQSQARRWWRFWG